MSTNKAGTAGVVATATATSAGPASLLGIAFVILKLTGYISWSWLWVLAPFWIPAALVVLLFVAVFVYLAVSK